MRRNERSTHLTSGKKQRGGDTVEGVTIERPLLFPNASLGRRSDRLHPSSQCSPEYEPVAVQNFQNFQCSRGSGIRSKKLGGDQRFLCRRPHRPPLAALITFSISAGVRYSRERISALVAGVSSR